VTAQQQQQQQQARHRSEAVRVVGAAIVAAAAAAAAFCQSIAEREVQRLGITLCICWMPHGNQVLEDE
jgi:mannitol/fructose-specific phosphotransferase system IIA component